MKRPLWLTILLVVSALGAALAFGATARGDEGEGLQPIEFVHNVSDAPAR